MDVASRDQALVKVRVRINAILYVDYLSYHRIDGDWLITSKAFHVESENLPSDVIACPSSRPSRARAPVETTVRAGFAAQLGGSSP